MQLILGMGFGILAALAAWRARMLSASGAWAAAVCGGLIYGFGGLRWAGLMLVFFVSSSILSRLFGKQKSYLAEKFSKGSRRDMGQVLANGGIGTLIAVLFFLRPDPLWWAAFAGAMAAVNADTWATEIGVLSRTPPRLVTTGKVVESGTSGAVSVVGYLGALSGAGLIAAAGVIAQPASHASEKIVLLLCVTLGGMFGAAVDSLLGATIQAVYLCPVCKKETERHPVHLCGTRTERLRGWQWLNNDWVNFICSAAGAGLTAALWVLLSRISGV